nr:hypothetical protein CFP56_09929 [Quercus suber]
MDMSPTREMTRGRWSDHSITRYRCSCRTTRREDDVITTDSHRPKARLVHLDMERYHAVKRGYSERENRECVLIMLWVLMGLASFAGKGWHRWFVSCTKVFSSLYPFLLSLSCTPLHTRPPFLIPMRREGSPARSHHWSIGAGDGGGCVTAMCEQGGDEGERSSPSSITSLSSNDVRICNS